MSQPLSLVSRVPARYRCIGRGLALLAVSCAGPARAAGAEPGGAGLAATLLGLAGLFVAIVLLERLLLRGLCAWRLVRQPLIGGQEGGALLARYERSVFTPGSSDARIVLAGLAGSSLTVWLGLEVHPGLLGVGALLFIAALGWDLHTWQVVAVSRWQVAWRRGWRRSVRRLPLIQVAEVHVVERRARRPLWLARRLGRLLGTSYLALELHSGKAIKLPRTGLVASGAAVERVAKALQRHVRVVERERRLAMHEQLRAMRRARRLPIDTGEAALRRDLARLRLLARERDRGRTPPGLAAD